MAKKKNRKDPAVKIKKLPPMMAIDLRKEPNPDAKGGGSLVYKGGRVPYARMTGDDFKDGGTKKFPDLTGDGKVTKKDILKGRGVPGFKKGKFMCAPRKLEAGAMEMPKRNGRKRGA